MIRNKALTGIFALTIGISMLAGCSGSSDSASSASASATASASASNAASTASSLSGTLSLNGSTSVEKVISALNEAFMEENSGVTITYDATGSGSGITAIAEGSTDIGLSSRVLKDEETAAGLNATIFALDGIAVIVNPGNDIADLTLDQIASIASGSVTNWSEVGGADGEIVMVGREAGSGTRDGFESIVGVTEKCIYAQELTSTGAVVAAVASNESAIGYVSLASVSDAVKAVSVDGVNPSDETVLDGTYTLQRPFIFTTNADIQLSEIAQAFMDFVASTEGQAIIASCDVVPYE